MKSRIHCSTSYIWPACGSQWNIRLRGSCNFGDKELHAGLFPKLTESPLFKYHCKDICNLSSILYILPNKLAQTAQTEILKNSMKMAKNWGQNTSEQKLTNINIVQQDHIKYYVHNFIFIKNSTPGEWLVFRYCTRTVSSKHVWLSKNKDSSFVTDLSWTTESWGQLPNPAGKSCPTQLWDLAHLSQGQNNQCKLLKHYEWWFKFSLEHRVCPHFILCCTLRVQTLWSSDVHLPASLNLGF